MSVLNKTGKMLQHDTYVGLRQCIWIYPITVLYILSVCIVFDKNFSVGQIYKLFQSNRRQSVIIWLISFKEWKYTR